MTSATILTRYETCPLQGAWSLEWDRRKLDSSAMLQAALRAGLTETVREDYGEVAGDMVMELAEHRGLYTDSLKVYDSAIHHAALADILTHAIRPAGSPPWSVPESPSLPWEPSCYIDPTGTRLRRVVLVSAWNEGRIEAEARSWYSLGEVCHFGLPMTQVVIVLGQMRDGKRHGPFSKAFMHPQGSGIRFRRRIQSSYEGFNANWKQVWREDVGGSIPIKRWLQGMLEDDILRDVCFPVEVPVPNALLVKQVKNMAAAKLGALSNLGNRLPDMQLSSCFWPVHCMFQPECHANGWPDRQRFVRIGEPTT